MNLYQLSAGYQQISAQIEDATAEELPVLLDTLESIETMLPVKAEGYGKIISWFERLAEAKDAEAKRLSDSAKDLRKKTDALRGRLLTAMIETGKEEIRTDLFVMKVKNNPASVDIYNPLVVPDEYKKTKTEITVTPDKIKIKSALQSGVDVPGAILMQGRRLEIK